MNRYTILITILLCLQVISAFEVVPHEEIATVEATKCFTYNDTFSANLFFSTTQDLIESTSTTPYIFNANITIININYNGVQYKTEVGYTLNLIFTTITSQNSYYNQVFDNLSFKIPPGAIPAIQIGIFIYDKLSVLLNNTPIVACNDLDEGTSPAFQSSLGKNENTESSPTSIPVSPTNCPEIVSLKCPSGYFFVIDKKTNENECPTGRCVQSMIPDSKLPDRLNWYG
ncbi:hypothetical protein PPL_10648 [Heterostelium album PN500]|uniref:Uncharacterized protein n=1 Tax=Heterostelium pallidum (strain ATCC 26659 / Pp 5 / PN500) TaxID=670386 RepID=D3BRN7_HETP5|nr:hypothetical protein PPL_10648 [Heterostelium album PN500]EFA76069.1 hypothetical protein PPL_10648 [Heterostelium album PN500]|eukprot:XP_020428203.1 hypothetical protein PPL_10648 [Heterostelium album PN500]